MRGQRLLHLHRLEHHDRLSGLHCLTLRRDDLDDRALHRADQRVAVGSRTLPPPRLPAPAPRTTRPPSSRPRPRPTWSARSTTSPSQPSRHNNLKPLAVDLNQDALTVAAASRAARGLRPRFTLSLERRNV